MATWIAEPLLAPNEVTIAVNAPAVGLVENVTVSDVTPPPVTVPTAPLLNTTVLLAAVGLKPVPLIVTVLALPAWLAELAVTTGETVATWTAEPLLVPSVVTTAVRLPAAVGAVPNDTVSDVAVAEVTVPTAPSLKTTLLLPAIASNPAPAMVIADAVMGRLAVLGVTAGKTEATWTAVPLDAPFVVTTAVKLPTARWLLPEKVTVIELPVAAVTVPPA